VGGTPVLGYDVDPRGGRLVINEKEAQKVREIFELYRQHRSLPQVVAELARRGWTTKSWSSKRGLRHSGRPFTTASLARLLTNIVYTGQVDYRGAVYTGEHPAIIHAAVFDEIGSELRAREKPKTNSVRKAQNALLSGLLFCASCQRPMLATYSEKGGRRYRYYVCHGAQQNGWKSCPTKSISATLIEDSLVGQLRVRLGTDQTRRAIHLGESDWKAFLHDPAGLVTALVESVRFEGTTGTVSVTLRALHTALKEAHS